jgi:hypothetical protein
LSRGCPIDATEAPGALLLELFTLPVCAALTII